jgi:hypothetical protein
MTEPSAKPPDNFTDLLTRLVRVPKEEIDAQEREYHESNREEAAKPRQVAVLKPQNAL